jgi:hypothetical protein
MVALHTVVRLDLRLILVCSSPQLLIMTEAKASN